MPETIPHPDATRQAHLPAALCHAGHATATRVLTWHEPDRHSTCGETYGPFYALVCADDACLTAAVQVALDEGAVRIDHYHASPDDIVVLGDEIAGVA
jgi:hypothetical protein